MIDPSYYIAPFALLYAFYIVLIYAATYARKKILEEGRNWRGVPSLLGGIAIFVIIAIVYFGIFALYYIFYSAFFIIPTIIAIPLIVAARANMKIKRKDKVGYQIIQKEISWHETVGIIGPVLVLIGCGMLFAETFLSLFWGWFYADYISLVFTWLCSLLGLIGVGLGLKGRIYGRFLCFIAGVLTISGSFIPSGRWYGFLITSVFFVEPYIAGIGGLLSLISHNDFLMYYLKGREFTNKFINIEKEIDKIEDLKTFLQKKLGSEWEKVKISLEAFQAGELDKSTFISTALKNIGNKFIDIFKEEKRDELNER